MATLVRTNDVSILIDPGAALGPKRYGLPPDKLEWERLRLLKAKIKEKIKEADIIVITHYHYDHYDPEWAELFKGKRLFLKDPEKNINRNQAKRAKELIKRLLSASCFYEVAEGKELCFGTTKVIFSGPLNHGPDERFGAVVAVHVKSPTLNFLHSSDVSGPVQEEALSFFYKTSPEILFIDGPATYLGPRFGLEECKIARQNLVSLVRDLKPSCLIMDHHLLRDLSWKKWAEDIYEAGESIGTKVLCGAEFINKPLLLLEAERKHRYKTLKHKILEFESS
ncbi:MBL fold metallo-hydrolase [Thermodesulfatator autotrophicus]|nr:MBL fold metallo-hydrolase [Thermodesulfatator autotrophicus]